MIHANQYRIDYLKQNGLIKDEKKHLVVRNFPELSAVDSEYDSRYYEVKKWIGERTCVYLQGLSNDSRASYESLAAVMNTHNICAIVLGTVSEPAKQKVLEQYGEKEVTEKVCFAGNFKVLKVSQYLALCHLSLVFYKNTSPNNYYCEANRLYQAIDAGLPVVVGSNPSMKSIVEELGVGVSVDTDGSVISKIEEGIKTILNNRESYVGNIQKLTNEIKWESQEPSLKQAVDILINNIQK
jgi:glycosyltransferase involved in cell wall biosynthesis